MCFADFHIMISVESYNSKTAWVSIAFQKDFKATITVVIANFHFYSSLVAETF